MDTAALSEKPSVLQKHRRLVGAAGVVVLVAVAGCLVWPPEKEAAGERGTAAAPPSRMPATPGGRTERISPGGSGAPDTPVLPPAELPAPEGAVHVPSPGPVTVSPPALPSSVSTPESKPLPP